MEDMNSRLIILNELYRISRMGMEASEIILPEVKDGKLCRQIKKQDESYINIMEKAAAMIKLQHCDPQGAGNTAKRLLHDSIKINTFFRHDSQHIAELMLNGSVMGIIRMTKAMNRMPECEAETKKLTQQYMDTEEKNIACLKTYL